MPTIDGIEKESVHQYIGQLIASGQTKTPDEIVTELSQLTFDKVEIVNALRKNGPKIRVRQTLSHYQVSQLIMYANPVVCIECAGANMDPDLDLVGVYQTDGPDKGTYVTSERAIGQLVHQYNSAATKKDIAEVVNQLKLHAQHKPRTENPDLIAVNNGVFNYKTKTLMPFSPDFVFLSKSRVDYVPNPANPVIHNPDDGTDWDIETWVASLSDDPEIVQLIWEILGAIIRPFTAWNKSVWFYSTTGCNGKGTLCALMRNLCGPGTYASVPLADFGKEFVLEPLVRASAIIVDENSVGTFIDRAANLKAVTTNDVIQINRKFKIPVAFRFFGIMIQCLNEMPRVKDKSESFYRRQLFVPFEKCFTGAERRYIKGDYLNRPEVLQYALWKVLNTDYYSLSEPEACKAALAEYKGFNDPVRTFLTEMLPELRWSLVPFGFLYDLYKSWLKKNCPSGSPQGRNTFIQDVRTLIPEYPEWYCLPNDAKVRTKNLMDKPEALILEYDLQDWMNPVYSGPDTRKRCLPLLKASYRGILRANSGIDMDAEDDEPYEDADE